MRYKAGLMRHKDWESLMQMPYAKALCGQLMRLRYAYRKRHINTLCVALCESLMRGLVRYKTF